MTKTRILIAVGVLLAAADFGPAQVAVHRGVNPWTGRAHSAAVVRNPWTGTVHGRVNTHNPWTGTTTTRTAGFNPWTGNAYRGGAAYNPWTGAYGGYRYRW